MELKFVKASSAKVMTPILMLTAKDDEFDKVLGLELGAGCLHDETI